MSGGEKAGIAVGVVAAGLVGLFVYASAAKHPPRAVMRVLYYATAPYRWLGLDDAEPRQQGGLT